MTADVDKIVTRAALARVLRVSPPTLDAYQARGMPVFKRGSKGIPAIYDLADVIEWVRKDEASKHSEAAPKGYEDARARHESAKAQLAEIALAEKRKSVVAIADVQRVVRDESQVVRQLLLSIPARVSQTLAILSDASEIERTLKSEIGAALEELTIGADDLTNDEADEPSGIDA